MKTGHGRCNPGGGGVGVLMKTGHGRCNPGGGGGAKDPNLEK